LRSGKRDGDGSTKGDRFRAVDFGPRLAVVLLDLKARQQEHGAEGTGPLFPGPGRWASTTSAARMTDVRSAPAGTRVDHGDRALLRDLEATFPAGRAVIRLCDSDSARALVLWVMRALLAGYESSFVWQR
jgi:hypothetical protein